MHDAPAQHASLQLARQHGGLQKLGTSTCAHASSETAQLVSQDPEKRYSVAQVIAHPWFQTNLPAEAGRLNDKCLQRRVSMTQV